MSLNGLDAPATQEAYQHAVAESGGWFLLKYVNRDSVELYDRGKGGVNEARVAVAKYPEASPLYGLIIYRRRKVLIKYVPEGTSRLLQARTSVHFQDVMEKYAPYETLLEFTTADGLSDTALAAVFPLHTASPAISSNRLNEISEDAEEGAPEPGEAPKQAPPPAKTTRERRLERAARGERQRVPPTSSSSPPPSIRVNGEVSPTDSSSASPKSTISQFLVREESGHKSISTLTAPSVASVTEYAGSDRSDTNTEPESAPPSKPDLNSDAPSPSVSPIPSLDPIPTEKALSEDLPVSRDEVPAKEAAPPPPEPERQASVPDTRRPSGLEEEEARAEAPNSPVSSLRARNEAAGRPMNDKLNDDDPYDLKKYDYLFKPKQKLGPRLVSQDTKKARPSMAAVPSNVKPQPPKKDVPVRPKSQGPTTLPAAQLANMPAPPPIPDMPEYNPRPVSRGSVKSLPSHKSTSMTPDKLRLMKAIELRKKQMRKSQGAELAKAPKLEESAPEVPQLPEQQPEKDARLQPAQVKGAPLDPEESSTKKADSGIEMDYQGAEKQENKQTLELLESPRQNGEMQHGKTETAEDSDSLTPVAESSSQVTPKAEANDPVPLADESRGDEVTRQKEQSDDQRVSASPPKLQPPPTLVEPDSEDVEEPSLDERQVFGEPSDGQYSEGSQRLQAPQQSPRRQNSDLAKRRRGIVEPLHLEDESTDDEFGEELRTATIQEAQARPIASARSPVTESFIRRPSYPTSTRSEASDAKTELARRRSGSVATKQSDAPESGEGSPSMERHDPMSSLKRNVSSGISARIQALADNSSRDPSPNGYGAQSRTFSPESTSGNLLSGEFPAQSRGSLRPPRSRTSSFQKTARLSARISASQQAQLGGSMPPTENAPVVNVHRDPMTNRDSVSVTARIVRPAFNEETPDSEDQPTPTETVPQLARLDTTSSAVALGSESAASVSPDVTRMSPDPMARTLHSSARNQFGRHKQGTPTPGTPLSPHPDDFPTPPALAGARAQSSASLASTNDESATVKEGTRTSRFFKRMSNIATKRRSTAQGSVAGGSISSLGEQANSRAKAGATTSREGERSTDMPPAFVVGNLNVQFPDSLLWKRRIVSLDDHGNLCFAIPQAMDHQRGSAKKFPLGELRAPYVPDLDRQELPFSVMLDFADGTTLQAACEDATTHRQVVHVLKTYWKAWQGQ